MTPRSAAFHRIELARQADATDIANLSREAIEFGLTWSWTPPRVTKHIADPASNVIVVRDDAVAGAPDAALTGFAIMHYGDERAHLCLLAVSADRRRRGIGSALLAWLDVTLRTAGIASVSVEARAQNAQARAFYAHHGFAEVGQRQGYYSGIDDAVLLTKRLRQNDATA